MRSVSRGVIFLFALGLIMGGSAVAAETIKIGMVQPLTGPVSFGGNTLLNGARLAVEEINAAGGILEKPLELVPEDGQCVPPKSVNAAQKLIVRDKVPVILGAYCSSSSAAVKPVTHTYRIPQVTGVSTSPKLTEKDTEWFFRAQGTSALYASVVGPVLKDMGLKRIAFLVINDDWGRGVAREFGRAFEAHGGRVVETLIYDRKEKDLTSYLTKIRSLGVDALGTACYTPHCIAMAKQSKEVGLKAQIMGEGAWTTAPFYRGAGTAGDGVIGFQEYVYTLDTPMNRAFVAKYKARHKENPTKYSVAGHTLVNIVARAIQRAGSTDRKAIAEALEKTNYDSLVGKYQFNDVHQAYGFNYYITQNVGGVPKILHTVQIAKP
ncbi:Leucine-, isoleucine-, valine-, threonine-, and alanine-binding protein [Candidatus Entotheonellaceae bacterium PAL068K]